MEYKWIMAAADGHRDGPAAPAEREAFIATSAPRKKPKGKVQNFLEFLYDKNTGKVLGRTGRSWRKFAFIIISLYLSI